MSHSPSPHLSGTSGSDSSLGSQSGLSTPASSVTSKSRSPSAKPPNNVFSSDGSFLDRVRRSMKEDDEKKKQLEVLERKKHFADRFKNRGKRPPPPVDAGQDDKDEPSPKKVKQDNIVDDKTDGEQSVDRSRQAEYHKSLESYSQSLKDSGTGVRSLTK